jgi:beta-mannosidase
MSAPVEVSEFFHRGQPIEDGWQQTSTAAGEFEIPEALAQDGWRACRASTVADHLRDRGLLSRQEPPDLDARDHWFRVQFECNAEQHEESERSLLVFDGLATLATVWFNGQELLRTQNMFRRYAVDVTARLQGRNELVIRFQALLPVLKTKKGPRRWPTRLVDERNLRFVRTTLLGRMPGWTPPWPAVGPYRPVRMVRARDCLLHELFCRPGVDRDGPRVDLSCRLSLIGATEAPQVLLRVGERSAPVVLENEAGGYRGKLAWSLPELERWWPHTHGAQPLYPAELVVRQKDREQAFPIGPLGFREVVLSPPDRFGFDVNGVDVFCRGGCWAPLDVVRLGDTEARLREALEQVRAGGMNMLRLSGTLLYEAPAFHRLCDELGILVWQDFMFANMDYPRGDAEFDAEVEVEARQVLERLSPRCSTALFCGGSETEQQAAMMGLPSDQWQHPLWRELLPRCVERFCPSVPYWYASPGGEGLPFWPRNGCTHYYGVGAYLRPLPDARAAGVRFASECLAFANPPDADAGSATGTGRVPQDNGSSWTFGDVTRHYVRSLFGKFAEHLSVDDPEYAELARRAIAHVMHRTQTHFRDPATECRGSLIWMLRDLEPGWGWGIIDCEGRAKSGYRALQKIWAPRAVWFVDEGLSGLTVVIANDPPLELRAELVIELLHSNGKPIDTVSRAVTIPAHGAQRFRVEELFGRFLDTTYAYRFGPPAFHALRAALIVDGTALSEEFHPIQSAHGLEPPPEIQAQTPGK